MRVNFVASADGAAEVGGVTAPLGSQVDQRVFHLLRELADVVLVGAGTVRAEGYGGLGLSPAAQSRRLTLGLSPVPTLAVITRSAKFNPAAPFLSHVEEPRLIFTTSSAPETSIRGLRAAGAEVVQVAHNQLVPADQVLAELERRRLWRVLCEGGPHLFRELLDAERVDELCLTISPYLVGPGALRIVEGRALRNPVALDLKSTVAEDDVLLLCYEVERRTRSR